MSKLIFKCAGALLILYAGTALGKKKGSAAMQRMKIIEEMCRFLACVQNELHYRCRRTETILAAAQRAAHLTSLPLCFAEISSGGCVQNLLDNALYKTECKISSVTAQEERRIFRSALEMLGACPAQEEEKLLAAAQSELTVLAQSLRSDAASQCRLYSAIGFSLGGAAALLIL